MQDKTLPKDYDVYLPGRFEEGNTEPISKPSPELSPKPKSRGIVIAIVLFAVISAGFFSYYFINQTEIDSRIIQSTLKMTSEQILASKYNIGEFGSEHSHAAIVVITNGKQVNFDQQQFQLTSKYIHFENQNPYLIHKHATGVPLEMLFASFEINMDNCMLNETESCKDPVVYLNGEKYNSDISQYEINHNDRILISSDEQSILKHLAYLESLEIFDVPKKSGNIGNDIFV